MRDFGQANIEPTAATTWQLSDAFNKTALKYEAELYTVERWTPSVISTGDGRRVDCWRRRRVLSTTGRPLSLLFASCSVTRNVPTPCKIFSEWRVWNRFPEESTFIFRHIYPNVHKTHCRKSWYAKIDSIRATVSMPYRCVTQTDRQTQVHS